MKLGNRQQLNAVLAQHYGYTVYTDDNDVVAEHDNDGRTIGRLYPAGEGLLRLIPVHNFEESPSEAVIFEIEGAGPEPHEMN